MEASEKKQTPQKCRATENPKGVFGTQNEGVRTALLRTYASVWVFSLPSR